MLGGWFWSEVRSVRLLGKKSDPDRAREVNLTDMMKALQFHRITPKFQFCGTWNTPAQFRLFLDQLIKIGTPVDLPKKSSGGIVITFDDGEETVYVGFDFLFDQVSGALLLGDLRVCIYDDPGAGAERGVLSDRRRRGGI